MHWPDKFMQTNSQRDDMEQHPTTHSTQDWTHAQGRPAHLLLGHVLRSKPVHNRGAFALPFLFGRLWLKERPGKEGRLWVMASLSGRSVGNLPLLLTVLCPPPAARHSTLSSHPNHTHILCWHLWSSRKEKSSFSEENIFSHQD